MSGSVLSAWPKIESVLNSKAEVKLQVGFWFFHVIKKLKLFYNSRYPSFWLILAYAVPKQWLQYCWNSYSENLYDANHKSHDWNSWWNCEGIRSIPNKKWLEELLVLSVSKIEFPLAYTHEFFKRSFMFSLFFLTDFGRF